MESIVKFPQWSYLDVDVNVCVCNLKKFVYANQDPNEVPKLQ